MEDDGLESPDPSLVYIVRKCLERRRGRAVSRYAAAAGDLADVVRTRRRRGVHLDLNANDVPYVPWLCPVADLDYSVMRSSIA